MVSHVGNKGLAAAFMTGIEACLERGADVIVNTDADNQYCADDIPKLTAPVLAGKADIVIGARPIAQIEHFSPIKKMLQRFGSWVIRSVSGTDTRDAPSGFRAFSSHAARRLVVFGSYTYTLETIIQARRKNLQVLSVAIRVNADLRPSRLVRSIWSYVWRSLITILRILVIYYPARFFLTIGGTLFALGMIFALRFVYFYFTDGGAGHVQSVVLAGTLLTTGFVTVLVAFLADIVAANRRLLEDIRARQWNQSHHQR